MSRAADEAWLQPIYRKVWNQGLRTMGHDITEGDEAWSYQQFADAITQKLQERERAARISELELFFGEYLENKSYLNTHPISVDRVRDRIKQLQTPTTPKEVV